MGAVEGFPFEEWFKGKKDEDLFSTSDVGRLLRMTPRAIRSLIARGRLAAYPVAGVWRVQAGALRIYLQSICQRRKVHNSLARFGTKRAEKRD